MGRSGTKVDKYIWACEAGDIASVKTLAKDVDPKTRKVRNAKFQLLLFEISNLNQIKYIGIIK